MTIRKPKREFRTIGEVCELLDIKPHVLRYWESQFPELSPPKNRAGNRLYRARDLETIALIRRLVHDERYTLEGARQQISRMEAAGEKAEHSARALERVGLRTVRAELEQILELLGDPSG